MTDPASTPWPPDRIATAEKYLDRILAKVESAKGDVEKNWLGQIAGIGVSLALVMGLGSAMANKLLSDPDRFQILYVVLPIVNTYFFVRFGLIAGVFSKARYNAEQLTKELARHQSLPACLDVEQVYQTNSYFEWAHQPFSGVTILFLLTIPMIFALNHSLTLYLLYKVLQSSPAFAVVAAGYVATVGTCYGAYYASNRGNTVVLVGRGKRSFIVVAIGTAVIATMAMIWLLARLDRSHDPIDILAAPTPRAASATICPPAVVPPAAARRR